MLIINQSVDKLIIIIEYALKSTLYYYYSWKLLDGEFLLIVNKLENQLEYNTVIYIYDLFHLQVNFTHVKLMHFDFNLRRNHQKNFL